MYRLMIKNAPSIRPSIQQSDGTTAHIQAFPLQRVFHMYSNWPLILYLPYLGTILCCDMKVVYLGKILSSGTSASV